LDEAINVTIGKTAPSCFGNNGRRLARYFQFFCGSPWGASVVKNDGGWLECGVNANLQKT
jgi:hypothetical protein